MAIVSICKYIRARVNLKPAVVKAENGSVAINVNGEGHTINVNSSEEIANISRDAKEILSLLRQATHPDKQNIEFLEQENQQLKGQLKELAARLARDSQSGMHNPLAVQAVQGLQHDNLKPTADYLRGVEQSEVKQGAEALIRAAAAARQLAAISDTASALSALQRATQYEPENALNWNLLGNVQRQAGHLADAEAAYRKMFSLTQADALAHPEDADKSRNHSVSYNKIGDIQQAQGDRVAALASYRDSLKIGEQLAQRDPNNSDWQRDLSVSYEKIGDIQQAQGDRVAALASYRADLKIAEQLAQRDPNNSDWQRDLSVSYNKIGDIQQAQGDRVAALASYRDSLKIREKLAQRDPNNSDWQTDVVVSCWKLSPLLPKAEAEVLLKRGLAILERLAQENRLTVNQQGWSQMFLDALAAGKS